MSKQNLQNYRKFYPLHHFIFYPISLVLLIISIRQVFIEVNHNSSLAMVWIVISGMIVLMITLSFMLRQHYALGLQDRIIINEFKVRYFTLTETRLENSSYQFSDAQIFALRFSNDEDLIELMSQTVANDWSASKIKKNIKHWNADNRRI